MTSNDSAVADRLLNVTEVAEYLGLSIGTIRNKVSKEEIPYVKVGRAVRFRRSSIDAWLDDRGPAPEPEAA